MTPRERQSRKAHKQRKGGEARRVPQGRTWREKKAEREHIAALNRFRAASPFQGAALAGFLGAAVIDDFPGRRSLEDKP